MALIFGDPESIAFAKAYRPSERKGMSWAEFAGFGPPGRSCKECQFLRKTGTTNTYYKCGKRPITSGRATDIRLKDPACSLYGGAKHG